MSRQERVELTVMCMVYDGHGNLLVEDRQKKDWPGVIYERDGDGWRFRLL